MRFAPLLMLLFAVSCAPNDDPEPEVRTDLPGALPEPGWTLDGSDLVLHGEEGDTLLRLGCSSSPRRLNAWFGGFDRIGSEERLSLGIGEDIVTMVAEVVGEAGQGVLAAAPWSGRIRGALEEAGSLSASYGAQSFGPVGPPNPQQVEWLIAACGG